MLEVANVVGTWTLQPGCVDWRYTHGANAGMTLPIVFLETIGGYVSGASEHSQSPLGLYMHAPALKLAVPSTPYDANGLLKTAIRDHMTRRSSSRTSAL